MQKELYFVSTQIEINFNKNKKKILAGNWCTSNSSKSESLGKQKVIKDIWNNKNERGRDYKYLQKITKRYSSGLTTYLNSLHGVNFSGNFWKPIFLAWLTIYLPSYFYRWKIIKNTLRQNGKLKFYDITNINSNTSTKDTYEFHYNVSSNEYFNYKIFRKINKFFEKKNKLKPIKKNLIHIEKNDSKKKNSFIYFKLQMIINSIFYYLLKFNRVFIEKNVFRVIDNIKLNISLKQFPTYPNDTFHDPFGFRNFYDKKSIDLKKRNSIKISLGVEDDFTKFLETSIRDDLPLCFIEGFNDLFQHAKKIKLKPKLVISSYNHHFNELFKVWIAHLREKKISKIFTVSHGGGGFLKYPACLKFEREISDKKINWHYSNNINELQLPASKFLTKKKNHSSNEFISYIEGPTTKFPSRIGYGIINNGNRNLQKTFIDFYKMIDKNLKKEIIFLPKKEYNIDTTKFLSNSFPEDQIKENNSFNKYNKKSKLNIISYPETTFNESIISKPTILLYEKGRWEFDERFKNIYKKLLKNKMLFHDPKKAAKHINIVSKNINKWWKKKSVQSVVNEISKKICMTSIDSTDIWLKEIKKNY